MVLKIVNVGSFINVANLNDHLVYPTKVVSKSVLHSMLI